MNNGGGNGGTEQAQMMNLLQVFSRQRKKYIPLPWDDVVGLRVDFPGLAALLAALDHGGLTGLGDDDHTIYAKLLGRAGGQVLYGGTVSGNKLFLRGSSAALTDLVNLQAVEFDDSGNDPTLAGTIYRNGVKLLWHDGTAARRIGMLDNSNPSDAQILVNNGTIWVPKSLSGHVTITNAGVATIANDAVDTAQIADGAVETAQIEDANVTRAKIAAGERRCRNLILNGNFNVAQRGASFAALGSNNICLDGWRYISAGAVVHTVTQDTDVPSGTTAKYSLKMDVTTADASLAVGDLAIIQQRIEGHVLQAIKNKTFTLSFWVKSTKTGIHCVSFSNGATRNRVYIAEYTINASDTWEFKTITVVHDTTHASWNYDHQHGMTVTWALMAGTDWQASGGSWITSDDYATSNQVNGVDNTANNFSLAQVQLEPGDSESDFEVIPFADELARCQRYYEKTYAHENAPGHTSDDGKLTIAACGTLNWAVAMNWRFKVKKRATPTVTVYNPATGTASEIRNITATTNLSADASPIGTDGCVIRNVGASTDLSIYQAHAVASAEL